MSIPCTYASHADAVKAGWFSRRHQTNEAHRQAQDDFREERRLKAAREYEARNPVAEKGRQP